MVFKQKLIALSSLCAALLAIYIATFVFSSEQDALRKSQWAPLARKNAPNVNSIEIRASETIFLTKDGEGAWFIQYQDEASPLKNNFPARPSKIDDLLTALTNRGAYPVRSRASSSWTKFGVDDAANRIIAKQGEATLLDLSIGGADATGKEIYIRSGDEESVRSGPDVFSTFLTEGGASWADTRLFPGHDQKGLSVDSVQRMRVIPPPLLSVFTGDDAEETSPAIPAKTPYSIVRDNGVWKFDGSGESVDSPAVDSAIRFVLDCSADDFIPQLDAERLLANNNAPRIIIESGDGTTRTIVLGDKIDDKHSAALSNSNYVYALSDWAVSRLWRDRNDYLAEEVTNNK
jgi:hypothetical protein